MNDIVVMGGSSRLRDMLDDPNYQYRWTIDSAYIMSADIHEHDIGIAELTDSVFFDKNTLNNPSGLRNARIVPICLGALGTEIRNKRVEGVGWGIMYQEAPVSIPRNPIFSSCMTSEASPHQWKFQNCDMRRMRRPQGKHKWECDKINPPPSYKNGQTLICADLFKVTENTNDKENPGYTHRRKINDVQKIYTVQTNDNKNVMECVNPNLLSRFGWCYLKDFPERHEEQNYQGVEAWGICSPSCDPEIIDVRIQNSLVLS